MFGAPPVGHVMDPQFKPLFLGGYGNMYANSIFPLKMHSNCESMDIQSPTELWKKNNYGKNNYGKKKVRNFSIIDRRRL